jgi:hypothetical protein
MFAFWIRGSAVMAFLMIVPSFLMFCALWVEPMLTEPGFERLGPAHQHALFYAGAAGFFFAFIPCLVKWTREDIARNRAAKVAALANLEADAPFEQPADSHLTYRG